MLRITRSLICVVVLLLFASCSGSKKDVSSGTIVYSVDYPLQKNNAFLYSILPKEVDIVFKNGVVKNNINQANLQNMLLVDCNQKHMEVFFQYAEEAFVVKLSDEEIKQMRQGQAKYTIQFLDETNRMLGFNVKKAKAINNKNKQDVITLWYTEEIDLNEPNWYHVFHEIPGVLLAYSVDRYGIRMDYKAVKFIPDTIGNLEESLALPAKGTQITFAEYSKKMSNLFETFEKE